MLYLFIFPLLLIAFSLFKSKFYKIGTYNEDALTINQAKQIEAICAIGIIFHHMSQQTCAIWVPNYAKITGLDPFLNMGYLFVSIFFFFSGFGLYKSLRNNNDYFKGYFKRRVAPLAYFYVVSNTIFFCCSTHFNTYTWYVYAILYLYIAFYISFKFIKKDSISFLAIALFILIWIVLCDELVIGTWVYNSIVVFLFGLIFSKFEEKIMKFLKKSYFISLPLIIGIFVLTFTKSLNLYTLMANATTFSMYDAYLWQQVILQNISGIFFALIFIMLNLKIKFNNKYLLKLGSMTLGLYLIHPLFSEMFSYDFNGALVEGYYIKNLALYVLVVLVISISITYFFYYLLRVIKKALIKYDNIPVEFKKDSIRVIIIIIVVLIGSAIAGLISNASEKKLIDNTRKEYIANNITYTTACGKNMATYIAGDGDTTIVFLRGSNDPCPTLTMKRLADMYAKDYKFIVLDFLGQGFSDDPDTERTAENITNEIHDGLSNLGVCEYILMSNEISELYARLYASKYKDEIKLICNLDSICLESAIADAENNNANRFELERMVNKDMKVNNYLNKFEQITGYDQYVWATVEREYEEFSDDERIMIKYIYFDKVFNSYKREERNNMFKNYDYVKDLKYDNDLIVVDFVTQDLVNSYVKKHVFITQYHKDTISNFDNYYLVESIPTSFFLMGDQNNFRVVFNRYMKKIYGCIP